jgi:predicted acyltransferase
LRVAKDAVYSPRLMSLDALRGFDMFWIVGAEDIAHALHRIKPSPAVNFLTSQLTHKNWEGVTFYDLIFPLFVFIVGVSLVFSLTKTIAKEGRAGAYRRVITRGLLLYALGIFYYGGLSQGIEHVRLLGVLQRIALAYLFAGLLFYLPVAGPRCILLCWCWPDIGRSALVPIRDISLEGDVRQLMAQTGITNTETLFCRITNRVTGNVEEGRNLANR